VAIPNVGLLRFRPRQFHL